MAFELAASVAKLEREEKRGYGLQNKVGWTDHLQTAVPGRGPSDAYLEEEKIDDFYVMEYHRTVCAVQFIADSWARSSHESVSQALSPGNSPFSLVRLPCSCGGLSANGLQQRNISGERRQNCDWTNTLRETRDQADERRPTGLTRSSHNNQNMMK